MDFMCPTGFGTVAHNVLDRLTPWFRRVGVKVDVAALNYHDKTTEEYNDCITVINPRLFARNMDDNYYRDGVLKMLQIEDYDLLWAMNDVPVCGAMSPILGQLRTQKKFHNKPDFKMLLYTPIDSVPFQRYFKDLDIWDELVTYTKYGKKEAEYAFEKVNKRKVKFGVIAHGVDKVNFKKLNKKQELRDKFSLPQDAFIFGHVNKNQPRKDVGTTLIAFKKLKDMFASKGYQQPLALYLHLYHSDKSGIKIHIACERLGLVVGKDVLLPLEEKYVNNQYQPKEVNEVYNCFDAFVTTTMAEGWGLCLHPLSQIETTDGIKLLQDINVSDRVLTHSGDFKKVLDTTSRDVNSYFQMNVEYSNIGVKVTEEHPFLVKNKKSEVLWVNVKDISVGDYVALRKPKIQEFNFSEIDILNHIDKSKVEFDDNFAWSKFGYSPLNKEWSISTIMKKYNVSKHYAEIAISHISKNTPTKNQEIIELAEKLTNDGFVKSIPIKVNRKIKMTDELFEVFGWYLAEGSNSNGDRIEFDLNKKLLNSKAKLIKKVCEETFGINAQIEVNGENKCRVRANNCILSEFFGALFGVHAKNKKIPSFIYKHDKIKFLIKGYFQGDGYIKPLNNKVSFSTISPHLAFQLRSILLHFNVLSSFKYNSKRDIYDVVVSHHSLDNFNYVFWDNELEFKMNEIGYKKKRKHLPKFQFDENFFYVKVKSIDAIQENQKMMDLCIEDSHSFVANGIVCHNTITEAMRVNLPIVCPIHTSINELTNDGSLVYAIDDLWEHFQIEDAENVRFKSNPNQVAEKMLQLYEDVKSGSFKPNYDEKMNEYEWDKIADQWKIIIKRMLSI